MNSSEAKSCLDNPNKESLLRKGQAVDLLYDAYGTYRAVAKQVRPSAKTLSRIHHVFKLPRGILWKISDDKVSLPQAYQISRLDDEEQQWLLAFVLMEEKIDARECKKVVDAVLEQKRELSEALKLFCGIRFDTIKSLLLPVPFKLRLALARAAWNVSTDWEDACFKFIRQGLSIDLREVGVQLKELWARIDQATSRSDRAVRAEREHS